MPQSHPDISPPDERPPLLQRLFDNVFLLLGLGIVVMLIVYTGWGMWELLTMPQGTLP
ncbi:MAG TPA: hypothetical protein VFZ73_05595 [Gemmatimonadaceae bacterium]